MRSLVLPMTFCCFHCACAEDPPLDALLGLSLKELANLEVVSPLKGPASLKQVPASMRVIRAEDIRENGYTTLEDALADLPGFQFRNIQGFNSYVFMRGIPQQNNKILLLVDGVQINELNSGGFYGGGQFNLTNVERIEVVYGPASALYGTNAISGIIHIITRDPKGGGGGQARISGGSFSTFQGDARYAAYNPDTTLGYSLSVMGNQTHKGDLRLSKGDDNWSGEMENFERNRALDGRIRYKGVQAGLLVQDKNASRSTTQIWNPNASSINYLDHGTNWHIRFANAWLNYTYDRKKNWTFKTTLYTRQATLLDDSTPLIEAPSGLSNGAQYRYSRPGSMWGSENQIQWSPKAGWRLTAGLVFEQEQLAKSFSISQSASAFEAAPAPPKLPTQSSHTTSTYLQGQIPLLDKTELFIGLRHDDSSIYGSVSTPRFGVVHNQGKLTAKLLYGKAFRAPKPWDYTDGIGNADLQPEKSHNLEWANAWAFSDFLSLEANVYRNHLENVLTLVGTGNQRQWINRGDIRISGMETSLCYRKAALKAYLNHTYTDALENGQIKVPEISRHTLNFGFQTVLKDASRMGFRCQYVGARENPKIIPNTGNFEIKAAWVFYAHFAHRINEVFDFQLFLNNLNNARYFHPSNLPASRFRQAERSFRIQLSYVF